jgi:ornithine cyclodeaminase
MTVPMPGHPGGELYYAARADVVRACAAVDVVGVVEDALRQHAAGVTVLPDEAYLGWRAPDGAAARSLAMPGGLPVPGGFALGLKVINGCLSNPGRGLARAQGLTLLFDQQSGWPRALMEAAHISALRTAAVSAIAARCLGRPGLTRLAIIGCGAIARAHCELLPPALPALAQVTLYDTDPARRHRLAEDLRGGQAGGRLTVAESDSPRDCVRDAELVVTATTATRGYIAWDWLAPGALVAHVSLDDLLPEVIQRAGLLVVDDWALVSHDDRRLLGVLYRRGELRSPAGDFHPECTPRPGARAVDTTLGEVLLGNHPGRPGPGDVVISNPFGMAILDIAIAHAILPAAIAQGIRTLPR